MGIVIFFAGVFAYAYFSYKAKQRAKSAQGGLLDAERGKQEGFLAGTSPPGVVIERADGCCLPP